MVGLGVQMERTEEPGPPITRGIYTLRQLMDEDFGAPQRSEPRSANSGPAACAAIANFRCGAIRLSSIDSDSEGEPVQC